MSLLGAVWRGAGRGDRGVGDGSDARGARHQRVPDQVPDQHRRRRTRLRDRARALCGLVCGIAPAVQLAWIDPQAALRAGARTAGRSAMRNTLMAVQVGLALVVLMAAGLFLRSFGETRDTDPGFKREGVLLAAYDLVGQESVASSDPRLHGPPARSTAGAAGRGRGRRRDVCPARHPRHAELRAFTLEGPRRRPAPRRRRALTNTVTPDYFAAMGIPMRDGPGFAGLRDTKAAAQAVVNEEFVRRYVQTGEAIGRTLEPAAPRSRSSASRGSR